MFKKVIAAALLLCVTAISVSAANEMPWGAADRSVNMPQWADMQEGEFAPPEGFTPPEGEFAPPEGFTPPQDSGEFAQPQNNESGSTEKTVPQTDTDVTEGNQAVPENSGEAGQTQSGNRQFGGQRSAGMGGFPGNMQSGQNTAAEQPTGFWGFVKAYSTPIASVVLLGLAFIFVIFYRKKNY